jgi:hypothetical protein
MDFLECTDELLDSIKQEAFLYDLMCLREFLEQVSNF